MKIRILFLILCLLAFSLSAKVSFAETFRVMRYIESFPPYSFKEEIGHTGVVKDVFAEIAKETGDEFVFVLLPYKRALYQFDSGKVDIEPMSNPAWRKTSSVLGFYSVPFAVSEQIVLYNAEYGKASYMPEDLLGETLGTVRGYTYPVYGPYFASEQIKAYPLADENKLIQMLVAGRLHQAIMNKDFALYRIKTENLKDKLVVSKPCNVVDMMIRFHPSKKNAIPRFNKAIKKLLENGTISDIYDKYR